MENIILQKTRYLKAMMLTMLVGLFAFSGYAQTFTNVVAPDDALTHYATRDSLVTFDAAPNLTGGTVYLYHGAFIEDNVLGTSNVAAGQTINFTWPDADAFPYNLKLVEATGTFNTVVETIPNNELTVIGTTDTDYFFNFDQSGGRSVTTSSYDLTGETVRLNVAINVIPANLTDSLIVAYSTNGSTYNDLDTIGSDGNYFYDLPAGAISASTSFRILQRNSGSIADGVDTWRLDDLSLEFGDAMNADFGNEVSLGNFNVDLSDITIADILNDQDVSIGGGALYPRDTITLVANYNGFQPADYQYVAYFTDAVESTVYQLDGQTLDTSNPGEIRITGSIPLNVEYNQNWDFFIKAYDNAESSAVIGQNFSVNLRDGVVSGGGPTITMSGGTQFVETALFLDPGGFGNYFNNEDVTQTFYPNDGSAKLRADFTPFDVEGCPWDYLYIYDGTSTAAPLIGAFNECNPVTSVQATNPSGALTFRFTTDGSVTYSGWQANISSVFEGDVASIEGGQTFGNEIGFFEDGARSVTTLPFSLNSDNAVITFDLRRDNNVISPDGTEIVLEYSTDGSTFTELAGISLNEMTTVYQTFQVDEWPAGVASSSTQFRFRQLSNNGEDLNSWSIRNIFIDVNSNLINGGVFDYFSYGSNQINSPIINLEVYDILANGQVFPGSQITLNYEVLDGAFPAGTEIDGIFDRNDALGYEYSIGSSASVGSTIDVTIPAVGAGTYPIYLETSNGVTSNNLSLQVSGLSLQVDSIIGTPNVRFQGNDVYYPGSDVEVFYTLTGTPGSGANLLFEVEDNISGEYVTIGTASTFTGSITANLPDSIDYSGNYQLSVSTGQPLVAGGSSNLVNENYGGSFADATEAASWPELLGYEFGNSFSGSGVRSAVSEEYELLNGARVQSNVQTDGNFTGEFEVLLQASVDGSTWIDIDIATLSFNGASYFFNELLPTSVWSETTQFRVISNEDEAFGYNENTFDLESFQLTVPNTQEFALATGTLDIVFPTLAVEDLDPNWVVGQDIAIDFNMTGPFPANTYVAAIIENAGTGDFELIGETAAVEVGEITGTLPLMTETEAGDPYNQIKLVPYIKATTETQYEQGQNIDVELESDFLLVEGDDNPAFEPADFEFDEAGNRSVLTTDYDLSSVSTASVQFNFTGNFDMNGNQNLVPRLQVSVDAGSTFQEIPINDMNQEVGLIYNSGLYVIEVPAQYLTDATHFRWVQPLNLGAGNNTWSVENITVILGEINALQTSYNTVNNIQGITLGNPSLNGYAWTQADLNDAVFNGESFDYNWGLAEGFATEDVDAFPAGTTFDFYLYDGGAGEYVIDPETGNPFMISSVTELGTAQGEVPFFVTNGTYQIRVAASVEIDGEPYYLVGDEVSGVQPGNSTLDVFLRAVELSVDVDPNENVYAGQELTFSLNLENDETNNAPVGDLFANLIMETNEGDLILATQQGLDDITVSLPTHLNSIFDFNVGNFKVRLTEGAPEGDVGTIVNTSELTNLESDLDNFTSNLTGIYVQSEMDNGALVIETRKFSPEEFVYVDDFTWDYTFSNMAGSRNVRFEYSIDNGQTWVFLNSGNFNNGFYPRFVNTNNAQEAILDANGFKLRWIMENPTGTFRVQNLSMNMAGTSFPTFNMDDYPGNFTLGQTVSNQVDFPSNSGRRTIATKEFSSADLENTTTFGFDLTFNRLPEDLTANQNLIFEFSTDGGATYTELQQFPEADATATLSGDRFMYDVTTAMKDNGVKFRWRQEDNNGFISLDNISFMFGEELPFDYINAYQFINLQALLITAVPDESCLSDDITLSYEVRGAFGDNDRVRVNYSDGTGSNVALNDVFTSVGASGDISFALPSNIIAEGANNKELNFNLTATIVDPSGQDVGSFGGASSENVTEIIAPVKTDADFQVTTQRLCSPSDVVVTVSDFQNYFSYQVINAVTGEAIGSPLTYDPEVGENEINLGELTNEVRLGLEITSASSNGTTCNTITSTIERDLTVIPEYTLFNNNIPVEAGTAVDLCGNTISLTASYYDSNGSQQNTGNVEWFRNDLNTPVSTASTLNTFSKTGDYFARVTDGTCTYTTESITVNVAVRPEQPAITVVSGDLVSCDENNEVVLEGPAGFAVYQWTRNGGAISANQRTITVSTAGTYQLQVSNATEANNCNLSNTSEPVILNTVADDDVFINIAGFGQAEAGQVYDICDNNGTTINVTGAVGANANIKWFQDGAEYAANTNTNGSININVSGAYYAEVTAGQCTFTTPEVTFNVLEAPQDAPVITATGDLTFCDGQGSVVLEGPEGFNYYQWNGVTGSGAITTNNTIEVTQSGTYTLQVGNVSPDGAVSCLSPASNSITVNSRTLPGVPNASVFDNSCGEGPVTFVLTNAGFPNNVANNVSYQLINAATDEPSGLAVTGNGSGSTYITSDVLTETTTFYLQATYADGSGCTVSFPETRTFSATPNNVTLEVQGAQLIANYNGNATVRWYRDGVLLTNATSNSITITDAAEYSVEIEYATGCIVTASSADIAGKVLANRDGMDMQVTSYPNPTLSDVTLNVNSQYMGKHEVIITSMTGQIMLQSSFEKSSFEAKHAMDVANLQEGIYNVQIRHNGLTQNVRIIKK